MKVIKGISNIRLKFKNPVVTLGVFDGVHLGHKKIIADAIRRAKALRGENVVITFDPHPLKAFYNKNMAPLITSLSHRINLIESLGADVCLILNFDRRFSKITAQEFIKRFLVRKIGVRCVVVGQGFRFGRRKQGNFSLLKKLSRQCGFSTHLVKAVRKDLKIISSSKIREFIQKGKVKEAAKFLGRNFSIYGKVKGGHARGRILGYPTANIEPEQEIVPLYGVYAVLVKLNNKIRPGILNIGNRPTFGNQKKSSSVVEVHIFNFHKRIYGKKLEVFFLQRIRAEKKFSSKEALLLQIKKDELKVRKILKSF